MNSKTLKIIIAIALIAVVSSLATYHFTKKPSVASFGSYQTFNTYSSVASTSAITVTNASTALLASSTTRYYAALVNDGTSTVYLTFNDQPAVANSGIRLNPGGGSYEITPENLYRGAIRAITSSGSSVVTVVER